MHSLKPSRSYCPWEHLSNQLLRSEHWQLLTLHSSCCLFRNRTTSTTYQLLDRRIENQDVWGPSCAAGYEYESSEKLAKIFLDVLPI